MTKELINKETGERIRVQDDLGTPRIQMIASLIEMQTELKNPKADTKAYNYKYATLPDILDQVKPILQKHGFVLVQVFSEDRDIVTMLIHKGGEQLISFIKLPDFGTDAQKLGSYITYMRRYETLAILGISAEDDDGEITKTVQSKPVMNKTLQNTVKRESPVNAIATGNDNRKFAMDQLIADMKKAKTELEIDAITERLDKASKIMKNYEMAGLKKEYEIMMERIIPTKKLDDVQEDTFKDLIK